MTTPPTPPVDEREVSSDEMVVELRKMQSQIIHGTRFFAKCATRIEELSREVLSLLQSNDNQRDKHLSQMQEKDKEIEGLRTLREDLKGQVLDLRAQLASLKEAVKVKDGALQSDLAYFRLNDHNISRRVAIVEALSAGEEGDEKCRTKVESQTLTTSDTGSSNAPKATEQVVITGVCCEQWKKFGDHIQSISNDVLERYVSYTPFNFCPWCSKPLTGKEQA